MSVESDGPDAGGGRGNVGVDFELRGALVARAGVRRGRVVVPGGSTVADAIRAWGERRGAHVRFALLDGDRLRSEVAAVRPDASGDGRVGAADEVRPGDSIRFSFRD